MSNEPVNINSQSNDLTERMLSNLAYSPFYISVGSRKYNSVEGFWQGLKFPSRRERKKVNKLYGVEAKRYGDKAQLLYTYGERATTFELWGKLYEVGSPKHWGLMKLAVRYKLMSNHDILKLLFDTGDRPITHILWNSKGERLPDSVSIPNPTFAQIMMDLRSEFRG